MSGSIYSGEAMTRCTGARAATVGRTEAGALHFGVRGLTAEAGAEGGSEALVEEGGDGGGEGRR
jgi:hypothetical protein